MHQNVFNNNPNCTLATARGDRESCLLQLQATRLVITNRLSR